jgi:hypothetical protein
MRLCIIRKLHGRIDAGIVALCPGRGPARKYAPFYPARPELTPDCVLGRHPVVCLEGVVREVGVGMGSSFPPAVVKVCLRPSRRACGDWLKCQCE